MSTRCAEPACQDIPKRQHAERCRINAIIRRAVEGGDADYETICQLTGLSRSGAYQRVHRLGLSHRIERIGKG